MIESDYPHTVSQLVEHARGQPDRSQEVSIPLKPDQLAALDAWIVRQPKPQPSRANSTRPRFSIDDVE